MIVARVGGALQVVLQVDHQVQCAEAAAAWGNARFERLGSWDAVVRAAAVHDEGWREWESAPEVDGHGRPIDFPDLDRERHVGMYRAGIALAVAERPPVGLLVSMHGEGLYRSRPGLEGPGGEGKGLAERAIAFADEQQALQERLLADLGDGWRQWAGDAHRLLQAWDALSLYLTWRALPAGRDGRLRAVPYGPGGDRVDVTLTALDELTAACDPFPFAGDAAELPVRARTIPDRAYASNEDLRAALSEAGEQVRAYRVVPRA